MLVVKVEIWPGGDKNQSYSVSEMQVVNISGSPEGVPKAVSDYLVRTNGVESTVRGHERDRGAWELVRRAIQSFQDAIR